MLTFTGTVVENLKYITEKIRDLELKGHTTLRNWRKQVLQFMIIQVEKGLQVHLSLVSFTEHCLPLIFNGWFATYFLTCFWGESFFVRIHGALVIFPRSHSRGSGGSMLLSLPVRLLAPGTSSGTAGFSVGIQVGQLQHVAVFRDLRAPMRQQWAPCAEVGEEEGGREGVDLGEKTGHKPIVHTRTVCWTFPEQLPHTLQNTFSCNHSPIFHQTHIFPIIFDPREQWLATLFAVVRMAKLGSSMWCSSCPFRESAWKSRTQAQTSPLLFKWEKWLVLLPGAKQE